MLIALAAFGALLFIDTFWIAAPFTSGTELGPRFVPRVFSGDLVLFSMIALFVERTGDDQAIVHADSGVVAVIGLAIAYALALPLLGYVMSTYATLALVLFFIRAGAWWHVLLFAGAMTGALYFVFERLMLVGVPAGPWGF